MPPCRRMKCLPANSRKALAMATNHWTGATWDNDWLTPGNWSLGHIPAGGELIENDLSSINIKDGEIARIQGSFFNAGTVRLNSNSINADLIINGDDLL